MHYVMKVYGAVEFLNLGTSGQLPAPAALSLGKAPPVPTR
jgi:hypothetical protein